MNVYKNATVAPSVELTDTASGIKGITWDCHKNVWLARMTFSDGHYTSIGRAHTIGACADILINTLIDDGQTERALEVVSALAKKVL